MGGVVEVLWPPASSSHVWGFGERENLGILGLWKVDVEGVVIKSSPGEAAVSGERYSGHDVV